MAKQELEQFAQTSGIEYTAEFVPQSKSRNAKEIKSASDLSLNWRVTLKRGNRTLTTDYMQGIAHAPSYRQSLHGRMTVSELEALKYCAETGRNPDYAAMPKHITAPALIDVLYSLGLDASVLDVGSFDDWAAEYGYDADSREAERTYKACMDTALKLRQMLDDNGIRQLQDASQDY